jgi:hypothetical protein
MQVRAAAFSSDVRLANSAPAGAEVASGRPGASRLGTLTAIEAIVRQDDRRRSNAATGDGWPLLLPDAYSGKC